MQAAYHDTNSLVTQVAGVHADHASPGQHPTGEPTSSSTNPWLTLQMYRHARLYPGRDVLDVGTGSGYGCGLLAQLLGDHAITSVDVDPYLTTAAAQRLDELGLHPRILTADATGPLDWEGDRIVSTVAVSHIPASWLTALRTDARLVTTIAGTTIIITARKTADDGAWGTVEYDRAGFMHTRTTAGQPQKATAVPADGGDVTTGRHPVINLDRAGELQSVLALAAPGIDHAHNQDHTGLRTATLTHPDGSWAIATAQERQPPTIRQGGPRRLWNILERIRDDQTAHGQLHLYGAEVRIDPDGTCRLSHGNWNAVIPPAATPADQAPTS